MGKYGESDGLTSGACTADCPLGRYRDRVGGVIPADCTFCPPGTWGQTRGLTTDKCTEYCPPGKYNSRVGQTSAAACIDCPPTFTGSKAPWGEQCPHRMPTRALERGVSHPKVKDMGKPDECGNPLGTQGPYDHGKSHTGNQGTNTKCYMDFVDYGRSHPKVNSHNGKADTAYYLTRMGYPRFCDTKTQCLNVGPFSKTFTPGQSFPGGEATRGTHTPFIVDKGTKKYGLSTKNAKKYFSHYQNQQPAYDIAAGYG